MADDDLQGFADKPTISASFTGQTGAFLLGKIHPDHGLNAPAGISDDRHLFVMAGSRAGKGTSMLVPNLLHWQGGVFCIDPKGENASITAMRRGTAHSAKGTGTTVRQFLGQQVAIIDPMGTVQGAAKRYRVTYNPLADIERGTDQEAAQIYALTESIIIDEKGTGSHFTESAGTILAGLIEAVIHTEKPEDAHLITVRERYQNGMEALKEYLAGVDTPAGLAVDALTILEDVGEDEGGSTRQELVGSLAYRILYA